jgi:hypothetical protein
MTRTSETNPRSAWFWVPSLYFSQGVPYVIVMSMSVVMYKRLGISNTDIALYTSWLYLPWVIKPLWSPWVDITWTKRLWVVAMQFLVSCTLALAACAVRADEFFRWTLFLFWIMAFASATHDIAADGFYMLSLNSHEQTWWVGLRSTFYRTAMIVGSGLLVVCAGFLEGKNGLPPLAIRVSATAEALPLTNTAPADIELAPRSGALRILAQPAALEIARTKGSPEAGRSSSRPGCGIRSMDFWKQRRLPPTPRDRGGCSPCCTPSAPSGGRPFPSRWSNGLGGVSPRTVRRRHRRPEMWASFIWRSRNRPRVAGAWS